MLKRFLPSVTSHCPIDCEVVVADNGSTDGSVALLKKDFPQVRLVCFDKNHGFAEGYNKALAEVTSEYAVLLNSDVEVTEDWLTPILHYMQEHPDTAAVQPKILAQYDKRMFEHAGAAGGFMDQLGYTYCRGRVMSSREEDKGQYDSDMQVFWASGACLVTRTKVFRETGGLDADFFAHMEEIDYCWRLNARGYKVMCLPESKVYHLGGGALPYESPRKTYLNFRNSLLMFYKNFPLRHLIWLAPVRWGLDLTAALQYVLKREPEHAKAVIKARRDYHRMKSAMREKRKTNMALTRVPFPAQMRPWSVLIHYYILRHKSFKDL